MSAVCATFACPPDVAERQPWPLTQHVIDYRNAETAIGLFNQGRRGFDALARAPELGRLLLAMHRAQAGEDVTMDQVHALMAERGTSEDEEE